MRKWSVEELPAGQQGSLRQLYGAQLDERRGYTAHRIQYVRDLTESERQVVTYGETTPVSPLRQNLYKLEGKLLPLRFNLAIRTLTEQDDVLRTNYCVAGDKMLAVVFKERRNLPVIIYRNLEQTSGKDLDEQLRRLMEADLRQGFDLRYGSLLRFAVYHTGASEYAVVVTGVQAVMDNFDVRNIFRYIHNLPLEKAPAAATATAGGAESIRSYWRQLLSDLPGLSHLPYEETGAGGQDAGQERQEQNYLTHIPSDVLSDLKELSKDNKKVLMSVLQTAWGLLLQGENDCRDVAFCLLAPGSEAGRGSQSMLPLRVRVAEDPKVQELTEQVFKQFLVSNSYAALARKDIQAVLDQQEKGFYHVLNFGDFLQDEGSYSQRQGKREGRIVTQEVWDTRELHLGVRFRYAEWEIAITFAYDCRYFQPAGIEKLAQDYILMLRQMVMDWQQPYSAFRANWSRRRSQSIAAKPVQQRTNLLDALLQLELLQSCDKGLVQAFAGTAKLLTCYEGDRLFGQDVEEQLLFVVRGKLARSMETGDGWYNTLDIVAEKAWANDSVLLPKRRNQLALEVLTDQALLLVIPRITMESVMRREPAMAQSIIMHFGRQLEKYQRLWLQS